MAHEPLNPENTTIVLIDFAIGFGNVIRSHLLGLNVNNALTLADTALTYRSGLDVTNGTPAKTSGPYCSQLLKLLGHTPIIGRGGIFSAFVFEPFREAVARTARKNLVIAGLVTAGCVFQTVLGGLREGYQMHVAIDACAGATRATHNTAVQRLILLGTTPLTAFSLLQNSMSTTTVLTRKALFWPDWEVSTGNDISRRVFQWSQDEAKKQLGK